MAVAKENANRFVVDLGDAKIPEAFRAHVNRTIQKAALQALADLDLNRDLDIHLRFPPELWGLVIRLPDNIRFNPRG